MKQLLRARTRLTMIRNWWIIFPAGPYQGWMDIKSHIVGSYGRTCPLMFGGRSFGANGMIDEWIKICMD